MSKKKKRLLLSSKVKRCVFYGKKEESQSKGEFIRETLRCLQGRIQKVDHLCRAGEPGAGKGAQSNTKQNNIRGSE
jgi:hypothetical protein